jgi:hypothetical protein
MKCPGCEARVEDSMKGSARDVELRTGWSMFMDQRNGLECVYVCPACAAIVAEASQLLRRVFGARLEMIHIGQIERLSRENG